MAWEPQIKCSNDPDERYARIMRSMWDHPYNDQRPAVLKWLEPLSTRFAHILDIGPGDSYYLSRLLPKKYTVVEPNTTFSRESCALAARLGIEFRHSPNVESLLAHPLLVTPDLVLMIHVLFYLQIEEIQMILTRFAGKSLVVVHPWLGSSVTTEFEELIGLKGSHDRAKLKRQMLGPPQASDLVQTHFRLPARTSIESLSFLVAHGTLNGAGDEDKLRLAKSFVNDRLHFWRRPFGFEIPQAQIQELYNFPISLGPR